MDGTEVTLRWTPVPHAFTYICEHATDSTFTDARSDTVYSTTLSLSNLRAKEEIHWRVRAENNFLYGGTFGPFSAESRFVTAGVNGIARVVMPGDVTIYPNPARESVAIAAADGGRITAVYEYSLSGQLLSRWDIDQQERVNLRLGGIGHRAVLLSISTNYRRYTTRLLLLQR